MIKYFNGYFSKLLNLLESGEDTKAFFDKISKNLESTSVEDMIREGSDDSISKVLSSGLMLSFKSISNIRKCIE